MEYVCHRRYQKRGANGKPYNLKVGSRFDSIGQFIAYKNAAICSIRSEDAYMHFARNDDGRGLERGRLTYEIAYSDRHPNEDNGFRFTDEEARILMRDYSRFIRQDVDTIIFNFEFFNASIEELKEIKERVVM